MKNPPRLTDRDALLRHRDRAMAMSKPAMFLQNEAMVEVQERLALVNRTFTSPAIVTGFPNMWENVVSGAKIIPDTDALALNEAAHDLVIHAMTLHWSNDPVGQMVQARRALQPDGLFLGIFLGGQTLYELRATLSEAEVNITGGLSPRIVPMGEIRDLGGLLQRAGLALPVADSIKLTAHYDSAIELMHDLRSMGETNALANRDRRPLRRAVLNDTVQRYQTNYGKDGRIPATFELITLTGWAPAESQPKPLRPGSATTRLADALNTSEQSLDDPSGLKRI